MAFISPLIEAGDFCHVTLKIIKLPWKPRKGERYYYPCPDLNKEYCYDNWGDHGKVDKHRLKHNIVFKTKEEAVEAAKKMLEKRNKRTDMHEKYVQQEN